MAEIGELVPAGKYRGAQIYEVIGVEEDMRYCNEFDTTARYQERSMAESMVLASRKDSRSAVLEAVGFTSDQADAIYDVIEAAIVEALE